MMFNVFCSLGFNMEIDPMHNVEVHTRTRRIYQFFKYLSEKFIFLLTWSCSLSCVLFICQNYIHLNYILVI